eukprot:2788808-Rhodomonas_salina.1
MVRVQKADDHKHPLVDACAQLLKFTVEQYDAANRVSMPEMRMFDGERVCPISPDRYVKRIMKYASCDPSCLALGMIYLDRLKKRWHKIWVTSQNMQRLFLVAVMEAAKFHEDHTHTNTRWAEIGGLSLEEINKLEIAFLSLAEWELYVDCETYDRYTSAILEWHQSGAHRIEVVSPRTIFEEQQKQKMILELYEKKKCSRKGLTRNLETEEVC